MIMKKNIDCPVLHPYDELLYFFARIPIISPERVMQKFMGFDYILSKIILKTCSKYSRKSIKCLIYFMKNDKKTKRG